jgi:hypothetical protein
MALVKVRDNCIIPSAAACPPQTGISVLTPNNPTLYIHRGFPSHYFLFGWRRAWTEAVIRSGKSTIHNTASHSPSRLFHSFFQKSGNPTMRPNGPYEPRLPLTHCYVCTVTGRILAMAQDAKMEIMDKDFHLCGMRLPTALKSSVIDRNGSPLTTCVICG